MAGGLAGAGALKQHCNCSLSCHSSAMILSSSFSDCVTFDRKIKRSDLNVVISRS